MIICSHVLGHIPDEDKAVQEMRRVLKHNGIAIIMTLIDHKSEKTLENPEIVTSNDRLIYYGESDLCRLHGADFPERLRKNGFNVEVIDYRKKLSHTEVENSSLGNGDRELIFKCTKALN